MTFFKESECLPHNIHKNGLKNIDLNGKAKTTEFLQTKTHTKKQKPQQLRKLLQLWFKVDDKSMSIKGKKIDWTL